ncbi:hypothetical protein [Streptomyces sp. NPDC051219]|uniref:hypothetical protein n=1 Tax=Streptomyces sp. NPDC051219 TaxID=3155283 RepID=UPI00341ADF03
MRRPADLTALFGEAWSVTVAGLPVEEALWRMGVEEPAPAPTPHEVLDSRVRGRTTTSREVMLLGRQATADWSLILELEGSTGWIGAQTEVLDGLAACPAGIACTVYRDPNQTQALFAGQGRPLAGLDADTGRRWGTLGARLSAALTAAGFPAGTSDQDAEGPDGDGAQRTAGVIEAATGLWLTEGMLSGSWTGGLSAGL